MDRRGRSAFDLRHIMASASWIIGVDTGVAASVYIPLRIIANQDGAEVILTVFRQPGMSDVKFQEDLKWVEKDLRALKALAEAR